MCGVDGSKEKVDKPGKVPVAEFALKGGSGAFDSEGLCWETCVVCPFSFGNSSGIDLIVC